MAAIPAYTAIADGSVAATNTAVQELTGTRRPPSNRFCVEGEALTLHHLTAVAIAKIAGTSCLTCPAAQAWSRGSDSNRRPTAYKAARPR